MHDAEKWVEQDLLQLIENQVQENTELDYKACGSLGSNERKKIEISKDVSALANSAGGVLVYGIIEQGHIPVSLDEGYDPNEVTKEWLEQVINSRIQQKIDGIVINPVELTATNNGRVAYVVVVPQSPRAPHQASDKRFYKRYNFESAPMEEYEIRDVSNRHNAPVLSMDFNIENNSKISIGDADNATSFQRIKVVPLIENSSPVPAEYIAVNIYIEQSVNKIFNNSDMGKQTDHPFLFNNELIMCHRFHFNHAIPGKIPIFEGSKFKLVNNPIQIDINNNVEFFVGYSLLAPYMSMVRGAVRIKITDSMSSITPVQLTE